MSEDFIITIHDLRSIGMCASGVRRWCSSNGVDFKKFLDEGMTSSDMWGLGDGMAKRAVATMRERRLGK